MKTCAKGMKVNKKSLMTILMVAVLAAWVLSSSAVALEKRDLRRSSSAGMVDIDVAYLNPLQQKMGPAENLDFEVRMNTHSVNLDAYQFDEIAVLRNDIGDQLRPLEIANPGGGGHHRYAILKFPGKTLEGKNFIREGANRIELVIKNVAGIPERVFSWNLPVE